ncbi:MAG TPA: hypothetical protein VF503_22425 [Sphingobium sp.]|uniref:hypothetical protein n=1 Tax=Sphingobium sp. TaxID=1912891 RepID=UPI002ED67D60
MEQRPGLSDPDAASFAWRRFRRILHYMNLVSIACGAGGVVILWLSSGGVPWIFAALTFAGIYATVLLAAVLMGLMFLSNGTGHDEQVIDPLEGSFPDD